MKSRLLQVVFNPNGYRRSRVSGVFLVLAAAGLNPLAAQSVVTYNPYTITTLTGRAGTGIADGPGAIAQFDHPLAVAADGLGNAYIADTDNHTIRKVTADGTVSTFAGSAGQIGSADGTGGQARFFYPNGVALDAAGNLYVTDTGNNTVRKITPAGVVSTLAGLAGTSGFTDGQGGAARFTLPTGLTVDGQGNVIVSDSGNNLIRKVTPAGAVTTVAGTGMTPNTGSQDGTGSGANFNSPRNLALDSSGNIYVADSTNHVIRRITPAGVVTTFAGAAGVSGAADGTGTAAEFAFPYDVALDSAGNLFVADSGNHTIRKITPAGAVTTFAGTAATSGSTDGTGAAARFNRPSGLAIDSGGNVYVADTGNYTIRKITPAGAVTTFAGTVGRPGGIDATGTAATFYSPADVAIDSAGNLFVADSGAALIRKITPAAVVTTFAGTVAVVGSINGTGTAARFNGPSGIAVDGSGNVYVAESGNSDIRKITSAGVVTTLAGTAGLRGYLDATGGNARFRGPTGVAVDGSGNLVVADNLNNLIRKVAADGTVTTLAGSPGNAGYANGSGSTARFNLPVGLRFDRQGNLYLADSGNNAIRKINPSGVVTTFGGSATDSSNTYRDGLTNVARFNRPNDVAVDAGGNVFVADSGNSLIRKIAPDGLVSTVAGSVGLADMVDGTGAAARFNHPTGIALDGDKLYVADTDNSAVRLVGPDLAVTTLAGLGLAGTRGSIDGDAATARFNGPQNLAVDAAGNLYLADTANSIIRKIAPDGTTTTVAGLASNLGSTDGTGSDARFNNPGGIAVDTSGNLYVTDTINNTIRKITAGGAVSTLAGTAPTFGSANA
ncbi:MAG: hypothetical protein A3G75_03185, partial [Verrucomicrobia bacterium RIFCSPLOWO2_12_FULL_64_8]